MSETNIRWLVGTSEEFAECGFSFLGRIARTIGYKTYCPIWNSSSAGRRKSGRVQEFIFRTHSPRIDVSTHISSIGQEISFSRRDNPILSLKVLRSNFFSCSWGPRSLCHPSDFRTAKLFGLEDLLLYS
jgi:hypothetical protein